MALIFERIYPNSILSKEEFLNVTINLAKALIFPLVKTTIENISPSNSPPIEANKDNFFRLFKHILPCKGHFYKIKNQNLKTIGYLFGTIHQCDASIFKLNDKINSAISKSKKAFLEFKNPEKVLKKNKTEIYKLLEKNDPSILKDAVARYEKLINEREQFLAEITSNHSLDPLSLFLESHGENLNKTKSWAEIKSNNSFDSLSPFDQLKLCNEHHSFIQAQELGKTGEEVDIQGLDDFLFKKFTSLNKEIVGLEKMSELPSSIAQESLEGSVLETFYPSLETRDVKRVTDDWFFGINFDLSDLEKIEEGSEWWKITTGRSQKFAKKIFENLQISEVSGERNFYAPGLAHLNNTIISYLEERGLRVDRS